MKTILIIWAILIVACILEGIFCSEFVDDDREI
jgi:hypothetical protein